MSRKKNELKICVVCGKEFTPKKRNAGLCCSKECAYKYSRKEKPKAICKQCGKEFEVGRDRKGMYCSRECQWQSMKLSDKELERREEQKQKSKSIKRLLSALKSILEARQKEIDCTSECKQCGNIFQANREGMQFCSERCRKTYANMRGKKRIYKNGKPDMSITLSKLYARDGGICNICGIVCDWKDVEVTDDGVIIAGETYPSIDHIVPLAKGGLHEWNNVQLLCRHCNTLKRDK